jgi:site-specific DNA recombinase
MKRYVALARVSSREQEREGFSLDIQEDALKRYATNMGGEIVKLFRIAETASKQGERKTFKEFIAYAKKNAGILDGLLFYKVDRAARNLFDYVELERLESEYSLPFISVSQPTDNNPAGRMMRRTLANMASFYTEQQAVDVKEGLARRVQEGWFSGKARYGYRNVRKDGRCVVETDKVAMDNVKRIFHLYAYEPFTLDRLVEKLSEEGRTYRESMPQFNRSSVHSILRDRTYLGEVPFRGQWYPGKHEPLVDLTTWKRVQALLGGHVYHAHELTYGGERMICGHCGSPVTGERKIKKSKGGEKIYNYYRCARYTKKDHPRIRVTEAAIDRQVMELFDRIRIQDDAVRSWFREVLVSQTKDQEIDARDQKAELTRQMTMASQQQDKLLNLLLSETIDQDTYANKSTELRDRLASLKLQLEVVDRSREETAELAIKVFELSQTLKEQWLTADYSAKRRLLEIVCLNYTLNDVTLCYTIRKPFDVLAEGVEESLSRAGGI